ncbi:MAG: hypothetical protein JSR17_10490 [Proteobacteria bacterium]|nr:hypothetical protein [Pseudomonadota bacterium]
MIGKGRFTSSETLTPENKRKSHEIEEGILQTLEGQIGQVTQVRSKRNTNAIAKALSVLGNNLMRQLPNPFRGHLLPAQDPSYRKETGYDPQDYQSLFTDTTSGFERIDVERKGKKISSFQVDGSPKGTKTEDKKYIIYFNGNATYALQTADEMKRDAALHQCTVINFDYPGVGESEGKTVIAKDMVNAGYAQVKRLIDMGVPAENIILKGQSIGGAVATMVAGKCHENGEPVGVINQRSFAKMSRVVKEILGGGKLGSIGSGIIQGLGWGMDALAAWNKIPDSHKEFIFAERDEVIPPAASLAVGIGKENDSKRKLKCGHNDSLYGQYSYVTNKSGEPARDIFDSFVRKRFNPPTLVMDGVERQQFIASIAAVAKLRDHKAAQPERGRERKSMMSTAPTHATEHKELSQIIDRVVKVSTEFAGKPRYTSRDIEKFKVSLAHIEHDYTKIAQKKKWPVTEASPVKQFLQSTKELTNRLSAEMGTTKRFERERRSRMG